MERLKYVLSNWKIVIHLVFRTKRFGVNNEWRSDFDSLFGYSWKKILWMVITVRPFIINYQAMKFRVIACHFLGDEIKRLFGWAEYKKRRVKLKEAQDYCTKHTGARCLIVLSKPDKSIDNKK